MLCFTEPEAHASACAATTAQAAAPRYARHDPERTLLYALVQAHYPDFLARLEAEDRTQRSHRDCTLAGLLHRRDALIRIKLYRPTYRRQHSESAGFAVLSVPTCRKRHRSAVSRFLHAATALYSALYEQAC